MESERNFLQSLEDGIVRLASRNERALKFLYSSHKSLKSRYLGIRGRLLPGNGDSPTNIFHASIQRTGSQWIKKVFADRQVRKYTGLAVYPQHEYEIHEQRLKFPERTFVPGLYIRHEPYVRIRKPDHYRTFYVTRDPRDLIVSWYRSIKHNHRPINESVRYYREKLSHMDRDEGLKYAISVYSIKLGFMADWVLQTQDDPHVAVFRFEDLTGSPFDSFRRIMDHCNVEIPDEVLAGVIGDYTKEKMRDRDKNRRLKSDQGSHYSEIPSDWEELFSEEHEKLFEQYNGQLLDILGY